jgi:hypothetical protein
MVAAKMTKVLEEGKVNVSPQFGGFSKFLLASLFARSCALWSLTANVRVLPLHGSANQIHFACDMPFLGKCVRYLLDH